MIYKHKNLRRLYYILKINSPFPTLTYGHTYIILINVNKSVKNCVRECVLCNH